jgi:hypothetical protein
MTQTPIPSTSATSSDNDPKSLSERGGPAAHEQDYHRAAPERNEGQPMENIDPAARELDQLRMDTYRAIDNGGFSCAHSLPHFPLTYPPPLKQLVPL